MKKVMAVIMALGLVAVMFSGFAMADPDMDVLDTPPLLPEYTSVSGTVVSIDEDTNLIDIELEDGTPAKLVISEDTVYPFESEYAVGDTVTGFYLANAPMILIWPPQYTIAVLVVNPPEATFYKADRFQERDDGDGYLFNTENTFGFRVGEETEVILANGDDFSDGELAGRRLVVIYDVSTRSMPELATATKVIVLYEDAVHTPGDSGIVGIDLDVADMPIAVNGDGIVAPSAFMADDGVTVMVPLRAIAEALGLTVGWDGVTRSVLLDDAAVLSIGNPVYLISGAELTIEGAPAPLLRNNFTYVPLSFFTVALELPNASVANGQIAVSSVEH